MAVRVRVALGAKKGKEVKVPALLNAGYEVEEPELTVPEETARKLGLFPKLPKGSRVVDYLTVGRGKVRGYLIPKALQVRVLTKDRIKGPVSSNVAVVPGEEEVILSDKLIDALEIVIEKAGEGLWRFGDEKKIRRSL